MSGPDTLWHPAIHNKPNTNIRRIFSRPIEKEIRLGDRRPIVYQPEAPARKNVPRWRFELVSYVLVSLLLPLALTIHNIERRCVPAWAKNIEKKWMEPILVPRTEMSMMEYGS